MVTQTHTHTHNHNHNHNRTHARTQALGSSAPNSSSSPRIHQCSHLNHMPSEKLAAVFSPRLFQTQGQTPQETAVVNDLIRNYVALFSVS